MYRAISVVDPTATIFPSRAASACASGTRSSTVTIRPLRSTRSAGCGCPAWLANRTPATLAATRIPARLAMKSLAIIGKRITQSTAGLRSQTSFSATRKYGTASTASAPAAK